MMSCHVSVLSSVISRCVGDLGSSIKASDGFVLEFWECYYMLMTLFNLL